jgi:hypothetical protein
MLFLLGGWGSAIDTRVGRYVPFHSSLREIQLRVWDKPERGILSGVITDVLSDSAFTLRSPSHELHTIRMDTLSDAMRARVVVGNELRIFAPLVTHEPEALTSANLAGTDLLSSDTVAPAAMMTTQADEVGAAKMMSKGAAVPAERMQLETKTAALPLQPRAFALNPTVLREACAVLPLFGEDDIPIPHDCGINVPAGD